MKEKRLWNAKYTTSLKIQHQIQNKMSLFYNFIYKYFYAHYDMIKNNGKYSQNNKTLKRLDLTK